jgi:hypothetical protein
MRGCAHRSTPDAAVPAPGDNRRRCARFVIFCHSLVSDWNHGNAHFLRGICSDLMARGHEVQVYEPRGAWSRVNLEAEHGQAPLEGFARAYPQLHSTVRPRHARPRRGAGRRRPGAGARMERRMRWCKRIGLHRRNGGATGCCSTTRTTAR